MTNLCDVVSPERVPVTIDKEGDDWVINGRFSTIRTKDRALANDIFQMVTAAYNSGRNHAFKDLRELIGAE